ncbi:DUF6266 family protein [Parapedobacter sp. 10938]|uniref:DUF6266 family protein n=1 Tax=Parapedobacter flavus TaxID=3110225 RepID=UPI002DBDD5E6|nr:DUF6266 family protein [Parapedobacter sp. 10938]MEC3880025.1 DUF6266 family protein [Parapedobacter sp. 10938]
MATFKNGPNGNFSGKVGNVIGYQWRGINVMRSLPKKSTKPRSEKQLANEMRMKLAMSFLSPITGVIRAGYQEVTEGLPMTPFNMALSYHKKNAIGGEYPNLFFDYANAKISTGPLLAAESVSANWMDDGLLVSWDTPPLKYTILNDHNTMILLRFVERKSWDIRTSGITRGMGQYLFPVPASLIGTELHVYLAFNDPLSVTMSDSRHIHVLSST